MRVLEDIGALVRSPGGALFVYDDARPVQYRATDEVAEVAHESTKQWRDSSRVAYAQKRPFFGFAILNDYFPAELIACDPCRGTLHLFWDAASGEKIATLEGHAGKVLQARYSSDGGKIVTASDDRTARIWNAADGGQLLVLPHASEVHSAAFSKDGTRIVTASANEAHMFDAVSGGEIHVLRGHEGDVNDTAFSHDGCAWPRRRRIAASASGMWRAAPG